MEKTQFELFEAIDTEDYNFSTDGYTHIFEMKNFNDFNLYVRGIKEGSAKRWRQNQTCFEMYKKLQENRHKGFIVKYQDQESSPVCKGL